jgi:hypothetical protein
MSTLTITEYGQRAMDGALIEPAIATQSVTFTTVSAQSAVFNASTRYVRLQADATCTLAFGTNPTAVTLTATRVTANTPEVFAIKGNTAQLKVAVVA